MSLRGCLVAGVSTVLLVATTGGAEARICDDRAASSSPASSTKAASSAPGNSDRAPSSDPARTAVAAAATKPGAGTVRSSAVEPGVRRFWINDRHFYRSDWYAGKHRKMIRFGCTRAPYYAPDPRCRGDNGFHHGIDIAMACGTRLYAGLRGTVVRPTSPGSPGSAYGANAFRLRNSRLAKDIVIGHVRKVFVRPGDHVARGDLIARASDAGAPDGCHLHFEVRPVGAQYLDAVQPADYLRLRRAG
jgi:murein DD-endopeptidase MepM/ murein hydrolase activator NlpD